MHFEDQSEIWLEIQGLKFTYHDMYLSGHFFNLKANKNHGFQQLNQNTRYVYDDMPLRTIGKNKTTRKNVSRPLNYRILVSKKLEISSNLMA